MTPRIAARIVQAREPPPNTRMRGMTDALSSSTPTIAIPMREMENLLLLRRVEKQKRAWSAWKDRFHNRKQYKYFKCPACGKWLRVPRHKGKIHINCRCGYTLYRRT